MTHEYQDPSVRTHATVALLVACLMLNLVATYGGVLENAQIAAIRDTRAFDEAAVDELDRRLNVIRAIQGVVSLFTAVSFSVWTFRVVANAHAVAPSKLEYSPEWAVGSYFVPIVNLYRPLLALREAYDTFCSRLGEVPRRWLLYLWWATFIGSTFVATIVVRMTANAQTIEAILQHSRVETATCVIAALLDIFAIAVVSRVGRASSRSAPVPEVSP